jgi:uncharacterized membrane protein YdbT with pleckstrin-like domain
MINPFEITIQNQAEDEQIVKVWRHHPVTLIRPIFRVLAFLIIPIALLFITGLAMFTHPLLFVLYVAIIAVVVTYAAYEWVSWYNDVYILTNYRMIDVAQDGFFNRRFAEASLDKIQDISFQIRGLLQTVLNYGDVLVQTAGPIANISMQGVASPESQTIYLLQHRGEYLKDQDDSLTAEELVELLTKHRKDIEKLATKEKEEMVKKGEEQVAEIKKERHKRTKRKKKTDTKSNESGA